MAFSFAGSLRPEDIKRNVKEFVDNYLSLESDTYGAAGADSKAIVTRIEPKDYVPNAMQKSRSETIALQQKLGLAVDGVAGYNSIQAVFYN